MVTKSVRLFLPDGMEARRIAELVQAAGNYDSKIYIEAKDRKVNAKSIMGMMSLALPENGQIRIEADGPDEEKALQGLETFCRG